MLLKLRGDSVGILCDLLSDGREAELLIAATKSRHQRVQIGVAKEAMEVRGRFANAGGHPAHHHLPTAPALDVPFDASSATEETLDRVGRRERSPQAGRQGETEDRERFLEPFPDTLSGPGRVGLQPAGQILEQAHRGLEIGTLIGAANQGARPGPLPLRQMVEDVAQLVDFMPTSA